MTCGSCVASVTKILTNTTGVEHATIDLPTQKAVITMQSHIPLKVFEKALPDKYAITEVVTIKEAPLLNGNEEVSKLRQLKPLLLIFLYLISAVCLLNYTSWNLTNSMLDFMGLFYIVFSFFKLLDLAGFAVSFSMYDPLAKKLPFYGWVYPFIEVMLGLLFLMRVQLFIALIVTVLILGITTIGVTKSLLNKKQIRCACLGTALKLPMTEATFIENAIMLIMAFTMLFKLVWV